MPNDKEVPRVYQDDSYEVDIIASPNELVIDAIQDIISRFSKINQEQAIAVHRFQHPEGAPSYRTIACSVTTKGIKNNPIARRDVLASVGTLGHSKHEAQEKPHALNLMQ